MAVRDVEMWACIMECISQI